ncbi:hypothetical protein [Glutamicibacter sp.]|uniref:hypothetical protein n=1 Tax=Glutamicibacter sp. TaxID=1931995 RepID=UPI002B4709B5|nr:hypothetical protein [Glutamicibacter sp.]HJX80000.1 hypothetical protein [Glutamicibacter sp.]
MIAENIKVTLVDPRYVSQENPDPVYRVDFWDENCASYENRLENAESVVDVLAWAEANRHGCYAVIWVEYSYEGGIGMARLHGWEPTGAGSPSATDPYFRQ